MASHEQEFCAALHRKRFARATEIFAQYARVEGWDGRLVRLIRETGALLFQPPMRDWEKTIASFVAWAMEQIPTHQPEELSSLGEHVSQAAIFTSLFLQLIELREKSVLKELSPEQEVWGLLDRAYAEWQATEKLLNNVRENLKGHFDPRSFGLNVGKDRLVSPDSLHCAVESATETTLKYLSYVHGWFDEDGIAVVPSRIATDDAIREKAGLHLLFPTIWGKLTEAWERSRLFGVRLGKIDRPEKVIWTSRNPDRIEWFDQVSVMRFEQIYFQQSMANFSARGVFFSPESIRMKALPPAEFISSSERVASKLLEGLFHLCLDNPKADYGGLRLASWLRGYALLEVIARHHHDTVFEIDAEKLRDQLCQLGLSIEETQQFIRHASFQRNSRDLFDCPLIKTKDGRLYLFSFSLKTPVLARIILSRIASLRSASGDFQFANKGTDFETAVLNLLTSSGINAKSFHYRIGDRNCQCDSAFLLDDTVFIFECKNYSIPFGHLSSLYYFERNLRENRSQAERIAAELQADPSILAAHLGKDARGKTVVPVVVHALPWSIPTRNGACVSDYSALTRLLAGSVGLNVVGRGPVGVRRSFWRDGRPNAAELIAHLRSPIQIDVESQEIAWGRLPIQIAPGKWLAIPEITQRRRTTAQRKQLMNRKTHPVPQTALDALIGPKRKIDRNGMCPCGSGIKYKKCCGLAG